MDDDALDRGLECLGAEHLGEPVDDVVEIATVGPRGAAGQGDGLDQPAITRGVAGSLDAEHPMTHPDHLGVLIPRAGHRNRPLSSMVGLLARAAASAAATASARLTPSGISPIFACNIRIALSSISGRGGQPGR